MLIQLYEIEWDQKYKKALQKGCWYVHLKGASNSFAEESDSPFPASPPAQMDSMHFLYAKLIILVENSMF